MQNFSFSALTHDEIRRPPRGAVLAAALIGAVVLLIYYPALQQFFIGDDFINLGFVRHWRGTWFDFLNPVRMYSDPVTQSRYKPFFIYLVALTNWAFGYHVYAYHTLSVALHVLVAVSVYGLVLRLSPSRSRTLALGAALIFATWRLHSQTVVWIATVHRVLSTALVLWTILCLYWRRRAWPVAASGVCFAVALLLNSEVIVLPAMLLVFWGYYRWSRGRDSWMSARVARAVVLCGFVAAAYVAANLLSSKFFPDDPIALIPQLDRVVLFLCDLFVPFRAALGIKAAVVIGVLVCAAVLRDELALLAFACALPSALLWACFSTYVLAPRYLYLAGAFGAIVVARVLCGLAKLGAAVVGRAARTQEGQPIRVVAALFVAGVAILVVVNARLVRSQDILQYEYLSTVGRKLASIQNEARRTGQRARVYIRPRPMLRARDLAFFACEMDIVSSSGQATKVVDNEVENFRRYLGPKLGYTYWSFPWFDAAWDGSQGREEPMSISVTQAWCEEAKP